MAWQRIRAHGIAIGADPRLASELTRLNLFGELTIIQTTAGHRVAEIYGAYEALAGLHRSTRSPSYERAFGGGRADSLARQDAERDATAAFLDLQAAIAGTLPADISIMRADGNRYIRRHPLAYALEQLCVEDRCINPALYPDMRSMLEYLAQKWGLTTVRRPRAGSAPRKTGTARPAEKTEAPKPKVNLDRQSWIGMIRAMRPDLTDDQVGEAYDLAQALKHRAAFVNSKPTLVASREAPKTSGIRVATDRPTLTLVKKDSTDAR